jgi:hypothetical protein
MTRAGLIVLTLALTGCVRHYFQPPKPAYQYWTKPGASELDVKKALLECGDPSPDATVRMYEHAFGYQTDDEVTNHILEPMHAWRSGNTSTRQRHLNRSARGPTTSTSPPASPAPPARRPASSAGSVAGTAGSGRATRTAWSTPSTRPPATRTGTGVRPRPSVSRDRGQSAAGAGISNA